MGQKSAQIDPSQCINKNDYYHNFKTIFFYYQHELMALY